MFKVYERIILDEIDIQLSQRNNIIRLQSLVHNQFSSSVFTPMIRYSWFRSGYTDVDPHPFQMVTQVCLNLYKITVTCLHVINSRSFDVAIATKYYVYK